MFDADHPSFANQPEAQAHVWRYMDLTKYLSLLESQALHFARADQMSDRWEGAYGPANQEIRPALYGEHYAIMAPQFALMRTFMRQRTHMSCWHLAEVESAAMWDIYQREGRGVAVRSTWEKLTTSITSDRQVHGAKVQYVNYANQFIPEGNGFDAYLFKRESFRHEQEVRLLMMTGLTEPNPEKPDEAFDLGPEPETVPVSVDLRRLVDEVLVAPDAPAWIGNLVESVTRRYGFEFPVSQSDLGTDPLD